MRLAALLAVCMVTANACTIIKPNEGDTSTIEHQGGADVAKDLTARVCRRSGQQSAEIISTVNKNPALPPGSGKQVTTFRCLANAAPPS